MPLTRPDKVFVALLLGYYAIIALCLLSPKALSSPLGILMVPLVFASYLLFKAGIPWVLENAGACGWGWCMPTAAGFLLGSLLFVPVLWLVSRFAKPRGSNGRAPGA